MTRTKTFFFIITLCMVITACFYYVEFAEKKAFQSKEAMGITHNLHAYYLLMHRNERDYFSEHDTAFLENHQNYVKKIKHELNKIKEIPVLTSDVLQATTAIEIGLQTYLNTFNQLVQLQISAGINPNHGDYGLLRKAAHQIEHILAKQNQEIILNQLLNLRRVEKDFMLNPSQQQREAFKDLFQQFDKQTAHLNASPQSAATFQQAKQSYHTYFHQYAEKILYMGLSDTDGLFGDLYKEAMLLERQVERILQDFTELSKKTEKKAHVEAKVLSILFPVFILILTFFLFIILFYKQSNESTATP